jgi:hypothetical protein
MPTVLPPSRKHIVRAWVRASDKLWTYDDDDDDDDNTNNHSL